MGVIKNLLGDLSKSIGEPLIRGVLKLSSGHGSDKEPLREPIKKNLSIGQPIINKVSLVPDCLDRIRYHKKEGRNTLTHPHTHTLTHAIHRDRKPGLPFYHIDTER